MNRQECDILCAIQSESYINQRILSEKTRHSIGVVNRSLKYLIRDGYLGEQVQITEKAKREFDVKAPKNAIILAAGFGMRMIPLSNEIPKGLVEVKGEPLIERTIKQLHQAGINDIYIVVGFMKERYEYLIDEYGVELIVNTEYAAKNNLYSLKLALPYLSNSYIIPCDIWCRLNPYHAYELYSWYMVLDAKDRESTVRVNRKGELVCVTDFSGGNAMLGIAYLLEEQAAKVRDKIESLCKNSRYDGSFWEEALYENKRMIVQAKVTPASDAVEINTYEQLRELDSSSNHLKSGVLSVIGKVLEVKQDEIVNITSLKKGMTNRSFIFESKGKKYIMRIPGEGTDKLIDRKKEADVYRLISGKGICDDPIYINSENGYKITVFLNHARVCDPLNADDLEKCMEKLRCFHELGLEVDHEFDLFEQIEFYESLWNGEKSVYKDYIRTKTNVLTLKNYIDKHIAKKVLTHIDAVPDNFIFADNSLEYGNGKEHLQEEIRLIDWEYAGMQDPHVDIAMFCIYSLYNQLQVDRLIDIYFKGKCPREIRVKIYCYIAVCGLLWSNWCEYKRGLGVEFGEYSLRQYRYAKEYYKIAREEIAWLKEGEDA